MLYCIFSMSEKLIKSEDKPTLKKTIKNPVTIKTSSTVKKPKGKQGNHSKNRGKGPKPGTGGRPKIELDIKKLETLCAMQCTQAEIESVLNMNRETINQRVIESEKMTFPNFYKLKRKYGKASLRRQIWLKANSDDPKNNNIAIFLSKNYLGMSDRIDKTVIKERAKSNNQKRLEKLTNEEIQAEIDKLKGAGNADSN